MALEFTTHDLGYNYNVLLDQVVGTGDEVRPRGSLVREVRPLVLTLTDPSRCLVSREGLNPAIMWSEIAMVCAGTFEGWLYDAVMPKATRPLLTQFGAYGPRTWQQLENVVTELRGDPDSRRGVVYVGDSGDLGEIISGRESDMPCTQTWQFFVRDGLLEMQVNMRSWDLVWGLGYDLPVFTNIQSMVAASLGVPMGYYTHTAGSGHVYERHFDLEVGIETQALTYPALLAEPNRPLKAYRDDAKHALEYAELRQYVNIPASWAEAAEVWEAKLG